MKLLGRVFLLILGGVLFFGSMGVVATWAPDQPVEQLKSRWARPPSRFLGVDGLQVHLRDEGPHNDPVPIVLLHGTSASLHTWEGWAQALRDKRRVIRFDLPGFGLTGPNRENDYSTEAYVRFVRAVMDKLGVQRFVLAGNSLGGQIAWSAAAAMPDRVDRLILVDASGYPRESLATPPSIPLGFRIAATRGCACWPSTRCRAGWWNAACAMCMAIRPRSRRSWWTCIRISRCARATARRWAGGSSRAIRATWRCSRRSRLPTLILWGGKDRLAPLEMGQRFARDIAGARLVVFEDLGHVPHEEDPARTVAEVRRFLGS